jgi:hypothetical protein
VAALDNVAHTELLGARIDDACCYDGTDVCTMVGVSLPDARDMALQMQ